MMDKIMKTFKAFEEGYAKRNVDEIDSFMNLFSDQEDVQMLGIGATEPGAYEWFSGREEIKEIILSDWTYWGKVNFYFDLLQITEKNGVAWFTLPATLEQLEVNEESWEFYASQMKELLEDERLSAHDRMFEAAHFGVRRVREKNLGSGHEFKMVISGVLLEEDIWRFHTLHWSMPVD